MRIVPTEIPTVEPILLEEIKQHLRVDGSDDDTSLAALIIAARTIVETTTGLTLIERTFDIFFDDWSTLKPCDFVSEGIGELDNHAILSPAGKARGLFLPLKPVNSVNSIQIVDAEGEQIVWASENYDLVTGLEPFLRVKEGVTLPRLGTSCEAVRVSVQAGFGPSWNDIPADIHQALLMLATHLFYHKGDQDMATVGNIVRAAGAKALLAPYRRFRV